MTTNPPDPETLVTRTLDLASLPDIAVRAMQLINDPLSSASDLGELISEDPALTARLLRIANSAFYGFPSRIDTVSRAITVIGTLELLDLVLAMTVMERFAGLPVELVDMESFWSHSLHAALLARLLATCKRAPEREHYFIAGLLHDIGTLVLCLQLPEPMREILEQAARENRPLHEIERERLGYHHGEVGAALLRHWQLPETLAQTARWHHEPGGTEAFPMEIASVHLADIFACIDDHPATHIGRIPPLHSPCWDRMGLSLGALDELMEEAARQFEDVRHHLLPSRGHAA